MGLYASSNFKRSRTLLSLYLNQYDSLSSRELSFRGFHYVIAILCKLRPARISGRVPFLVLCIFSQCCNLASSCVLTEHSAQVRQRWLTSSRGSVVCACLPRCAHKIRDLSSSYLNIKRALPSCQDSPSVSKCVANISTISQLLCLWLYQYYSTSN